MSKTMQTHVQGATYCADGSSACHFTQAVEVIIKPLWWQEKGFSYTATGYGKRIPTQYMVRFNGKWRRVYCKIYSNNGTLYIGKLNAIGERLIVQINNEG